MERKQTAPPKIALKKNSKGSVNPNPMNPTKSTHGEFQPELGTHQSPAFGKSLFENDANDLVKGIILAEVLGKPLCRRYRR